MSFPAAVRSCLRQYVTFTGRARRSEFWWFYLFQVLALLVPYLAGLVLVIAGAEVSDEPGGASATGNVLLGAGFVALGLFFLINLALLLPSIAVAVRRLHDTSRSGLWYLLSFVPFGGIVVLVFCVLDSTPGPNQHGPNPKGVDAPPAPWGPYQPQAYPPPYPPAPGATPYPAAPQYPQQGPYPPPGGTTPNPLPPGPSTP